jgi:hypothetical protein
MLNDIMVEVNFYFESKNYESYYFKLDETSLKF